MSEESAERQNAMESELEADRKSIADAQDIVRSFCENMELHITWTIWNGSFPSYVMI